MKTERKKKVINNLRSFFIKRTLNNRKKAMCLNGEISLTPLHQIIDLKLIDDSCLSPLHHNNSV